MSDEAQEEKPRKPGPITLLLTKEEHARKEREDSAAREDVKDERTLERLESAWEGRAAAAERSALLYFRLTIAMLAIVSMLVAGTVAVGAGGEGMTYGAADLMLAGMLALAVCVVLFFAWRYRAWLLERKEYVAALLGMVAAAVGMVLLGRRDTPAPPTRDTTREADAAKKEAEQVRAAVVRHNASTEERQAVAHIADPHEQTKALADLIKKRRKG